jgi:RNA polymerase sigma factor (TIGR02999 family)
MAQEDPGHTLQATALVHEAYVRLVDAAEARQWNSRGHFFAAAAEAMRRILVENARRKRSLKGGGRLRRIDLETADVTADLPPEGLLDLDDALNRLEQEDAAAARIAKLRLFGGLSIDEAAQAAGISRSTAYEHWAYARAWLQVELGRPHESDSV